MKNQLITLKDKQPKLDGVTFTLNYRDKTLISIRITDDCGGFVEIMKEGTYTDGLSLLVKAPPEMEKVYTVVHVLAETRYSKDFTDEGEAREFMRKIEYVPGIEVSMDASERFKADPDAKPACQGGEELPF